MGKRYYYVGRAGMTVSIFTDNNGNDYQDAIRVDIDNTKVPSDLTDFVIVVNAADIDTQLSTVDADHFFNNVKSDGGDLRASKSDQSTELPIEIESFDASSRTGAIWFNTEGVLSSSSTTTFFIYYNSSASFYAETDTYGKHAVRPTSWKMNHLMNQDPSGTAPQMIDSTPNNNDATNNGGLVAGNLIDTILGKGVDFEAANASDSLDLPNDSSYRPTDAITTQMLVKLEDDSVSRQAIRSVEQNETDFGFSNFISSSGNYQFFLRVGGSGNVVSIAIPDTTGYHLYTSVYDGSTQTIYLDDTTTNDSQALSGLIQYGNSYGTIAYDGSANPLDGKITLISVLDTALSVDFIKAQNNNYRDSNNFYSLSKV